MTENEKRKFYESAARRFKAELKLSGATAAIHLENKNDEVFWAKVLHHAYPKGKFRFISSSRSETGNVTCGCTQCLKYIDYLDERFLIAIDSDYRYLHEEPYMNARNFVLQTYTYSFENHFCFASNLQRAFDACTNKLLPFNFSAFLKDYSRIVYPLMVWQLYLEGIDANAFPKNVFHRILSVNSCPAGFWLNNGAPVLEILRKRAGKFLYHLKKNFPEADNTWHEARCNELGVRRDNCYLFVRGHNIYDMLVYMGRKMVAAARNQNPELQRDQNFEQTLLSHLCFGQYPELERIGSDVKQILSK